MKKSLFIVLLIYVGIASVVGTVTSVFLLFEWWYTPGVQTPFHLPPYSEVDLSPELEPYTMFGSSKNQTTATVNMPAEKGDTAPPEITTNSIGFRHGELSQEKPENTCRIIMVGGSVVFFGHTNETTIPAFLAKKLQEKTPLKKVEVVNAGIPNFISDQELVLITTKLIDLNPDIIIVFDGFNDFMIPTTYESRIGYPYKFQALELAWIDNKKIMRRLLDLPLLEHIKAGSHFLHLYYPNWSYISLLRDMGKTKAAPKAESPSPQELSAHLIVNWQKMARILRANQVKGLFILQPFNESGKLYDQHYSMTESKINSLNREFMSTENDIQFLSYRRVMQNKEDWFYDIVHTYDAGNDYYAGLMSRDISKLLPK